MNRSLILVISGVAVGIILGTLIAVTFAGSPLPELSPMPPLADTFHGGSTDDHLARALVDSLHAEDIERIRSISKLTTDIEILLYENQGEILRSLFAARPTIEFYGSVNLGERERRSIWKVLEVESGNEALLSLWITDDTIRHFRIER